MSPCLSYFVAAFVSSVLTVGHCAVQSIVLDMSRQQNVSATLFLCQRLVSATRSSTSTTYFHAFLVQSPVSRNKPLANRSRFAFKLTISFACAFVRANG
jgi:hypothetical protein